MHVSSDFGTIGWFGEIGVDICVLWYCRIETNVSA